MKIWYSVTSVPWIFADLLDNSDEAYFITYRSLATLKKDIETVAKESFHGISAIARDQSLRAYYVFARGDNGKGHTPLGYERG